MGPVYLIDFECYKPDEELKVNYEDVDRVWKENMQRIKEEKEAEAAQQAAAALVDGETKDAAPAGQINTWDDEFVAKFIARVSNGRMFAVLMLRIGIILRLVLATVVGPCTSNLCFADLLRARCIEVTTPLYSFSKTSLPVKVFSKHASFTLVLF